MSTATGWSRPTDGTLVTSFYDWSDIDQHWRDADIFPVVSEGAPARHPRDPGPHRASRLPARIGVNRRLTNECVNLGLTHE